MATSVLSRRIVGLRKMNRVRRVWLSRRERKQVADHRQAAQSRHPAVGAVAVVGDQPAQHDRLTVVGQGRGLDAAAVGDQVGRADDSRRAPGTKSPAQTSSRTTPPSCTRGTTRRVRPTSSRLMVVKGLVELPSVAKLPVRNGTFWPTTISAGSLSSTVMLGEDSRFAADVGAHRLKQQPEVALATPPPATGPPPAGARPDSRGQLRTVPRSDPALEKPVPPDHAVGRHRAAEPKLHADLFAQFAGDLDDGDLDLHLGATQVELVDDHVLQHVDGRGRPAHDDGVQLGRGLDRDAVQGEALRPSGGGRADPGWQRTPGPRLRSGPRPPGPPCRGWRR